MLSNVRTPTRTRWQWSSIFSFSLLLFSFCFVSSAKFVFAKDLIVVDFKDFTSSTIPYTTETGTQGAEFLGDCGIPRFFSSYGSINLQNSGNNISIKNSIYYMTHNFTPPMFCNVENFTFPDDSCMNSAVLKTGFLFNYTCNNIPLNKQTFLYTVPNPEWPSFYEEMRVLNAIEIKSNATEKVFLKGLIIDPGINFENSNHEYSYQFPLTITAKRNNDIVTKKDIIIDVSSSCIKTGSNSVTSNNPLEKCLMKDHKIVLDKDFIIKKMMCTYFTVIGPGTYPGLNCFGFGDPNDYKDEFIIDSTNLNFKTYIQYERPLGYGQPSSFFNDSPHPILQGFSTSKIVISDMASDEKCGPDTPLGKFRKILANTAEPMKTY